MIAAELYSFWAGEVGAMSIVRFTIKGAIVVFETKGDFRESELFELYVPTFTHHLGKEAHTA